MHLSLDDSEIKEAIELYVNQQGINTDGASVEIKLRSGRSGRGHSAEVVISQKKPDSDGSGGTSSVFGD